MSLPAGQPGADHTARVQPPLITISRPSTQPKDIPPVTLSAADRVERNVRITTGRLPLSFEPNTGQPGAPAGFLTRALGGTVVFAPGQVLLNLPAPDQDEPAADVQPGSQAARPRERHARLVPVQFVGSRRQASLVPGDPGTTIVNYFIGPDPARWRTNVPTYQSVSYRALYPGIDLTYGGEAGALKSTYTVAPGADAGLVRWRYPGAPNPAIDSSGDLIVKFPGRGSARESVLNEQAPVAWQTIAGRRVPVSVRFVVAADRTVAFELGDYDPSFALTIDPTISYSTYLGGSQGGGFNVGLDEANGIAVDGANNVYIAGSTRTTDFITTTNAYQTSIAAGRDVFVTRLNHDGSAALYSTYLGGDGEDWARGIAVDAGGNAHVVGASGGTFPTTANAFDTTPDPWADGFFTRLNANGTALLYSTLLGGGGRDEAMAVAVDASGYAYVSGYAGSTTFPTTAGALQASNAGQSDAFVARIAPFANLSSAQTLVYSTYLGGSCDDGAAGIDLDADGNIYIGGTTSSQGAGSCTGKFPLHNALQPNYGGGNNDGFVAKLSASGSSLLYSTFLGGAHEDSVRGVAVDEERSAYVVGDTGSTDFPLTDYAYRRSSGWREAFVAKLEPSGKSLRYSTYLGGSGHNEFAGGIALDASGNAYVTGYTASAEFPQVSPVQSGHAGGGYDGFVTRLNATGTAADYSTFLGGSSEDRANAIAVGAGGDAYIAGVTDSSDFPTTSGALDGTNNYRDAFVTRISGPSGDEGPEDNELGSFCAVATSCETPKPVNTASGNFWHTFGDLTIPGRGPQIALSRTYSAIDAARLGPLGYGWTHSYNMSVVTDTASASYHVRQQNGAVAPFPTSGTRHSRVLADLTRGVNGSFVFTHTHGLTSYHFDGNGRLESIVDRLGYTTSLSYDANNRLANVTEPAGRAITFTYWLTSGFTNLVHTVSDPAGRSVAFEYNANKELNLATDVAGNQHRFGYDATHRMLSMTDPKGGMITNTYEAAPSYRVTRQVDAMNRALDFAYSSCGTYCTRTVLTDSLGLATSFTYDQNRLVRLKRNLDANTAATWVYAYDPVYTTGVSAVQDPLGRVSSFSYDAAGNRLSSADTLGRTTRFAYNATNDLLVVTNTLGLTTSFGYAANGNLLSVSRPLTETGQLVTAGFGYDPLQPADVLTITNPLGNSWRNSYDANGLPATSSNPLGETSRFGYDAIGRLLSVTSPRNYTSTATYNAYGQPLVVTDTLGFTTSFSYDANGNLSGATDARGRSTSYSYNAGDEPLRVTRPDGTHSDYGYDAGGRVITQSNGLGQTISYSYDNLSRLVLVTDPLNNSSSYAYDLAGNPTVITDAAGLRTELSYDAAYQLRTVDYQASNTPDVSFSYNALGYRTAMTDGTGTSSYVYDSLQRLTSHVNGAGSGVGYGYDLGGRLTALTYPGSSQVTYGYDSTDRMQTLTDWLSNTTNFDYDAEGNLLAQIYPNNTRADLSFDAAGGLSTLAHTSGGSPILSLSYTRDALGLLSLANEGSLGSHSYSYDALNRLLGEQLNGASAISSTWSYDAATNIQKTSTTPGQPVSAWSSLSGAAASGNTLQKTSGVAYQWDAGGVSTEQVSSGDVAVQATADNVGHYTQFGLGSSNTTASGDDIDFSIRLAEGNVQVFELGTQRGGNWTSYVPGDILKVALESGVVRYYKNEVAFYSSTVEPTYPLRFDSSLADPSSRILNAQLTAGQHNLSWTSLDDVTANGNTIRKTGGVAYQWDAGAVSSQSVSSGDVAARSTAYSADHYTQFGLGRNNTSASGDDIDYSIRLAEGNAQVFELGTKRGGNWTTYVQGDVFRVAVESDVVKYYKNGVSFYTSQVTPSYPLRFDSSLADPNSRIWRAYFEAGAAPLMEWSSIDDVTAEGNTIKKTGGVAYAWDAGAVSSKSASAGDVYAQATADNADHYTQFGLGSSNTTASGDDIDFSIRLAEGNVQVFELGTQRGGNWTTYVHGDVLTVAVVQGVVRYYKNGSLFYTSQVTPTYPLRFDSSLADPNSRILSAQFGTGAVTAVSSTRSYNDVGQLLSLVEALGAHNKKNLAFTYSLTGNRTQQVDSAIGLTTTYGYDQANRLIDYNSGAATYAYNGDGLRMSKTKAGSTEQFVWDIGAGLPLLLKDGTASYIYGPGGMILAQVRTDNTVYYYHADQLGSVRALTNSSGAIVATYQYNAYGSVISKTGTITNPFGYAGEYTDGESGLIYLRARYYDPATQQFISRDPIYTITEEPYGYVGGSPSNATDPSGLSDALGESGASTRYEMMGVSWTCRYIAAFIACSAADEYALRYNSWVAAAMWAESVRKAGIVWGGDDSFGPSHACYASATVSSGASGGPQGRGVRAGPATGKTRLWRAVTDNELVDILTHGDYNIHPNSTFKRFAFSEADVDAFIRANPGRKYTKTYIDVPNEKLALMTRHPDPGGAREAIGIDVYEHPEFYTWFDKVYIMP